MKTSLSHLPLNKQEELERVTQLIVETVAPAKIILFGSHATGTWVEDRYTEGHITYEYISDYDLLVVTNPGEIKKDYEITDQIKNRLRYRTPVSVITHDLDYINEKLKIGQYFFADIVKEGILLYNGNGAPFADPIELSADERKKIAQQDFKKWFESATEFLASVNFSHGRSQYKIGVFILHQAAERTYNAVMLVFSGYKPKTHNLDKLRTYTKGFSKELYSVFPCNSAKEEHLFSLLVKGYIDARYKDDYIISKEELEILINRVEKLQNVAEKICKDFIEKIN